MIYIKIEPTGYLGLIGSTSDISEFVIAVVDEEIKDILTDPAYKFVGV